MLRSSKEFRVLGDLQYCDALTFPSPQGESSVVQFKYMCLEMYSFAVL